MSPRAIACCLAATALAVSGCAGGDSGQSGNGSRYVAGNGASQVIKAADRKRAPRVDGKDLEDRPVRLDAYQGKVVVMNFWASWCSPCRAEASALHQIEAETRAKGVAFLGVNVKDQMAAARAFQRNFKITYPSLFDQSAQTAVAFKDVPPNAVPSTLVLDRRGRVAVRIIGSTTYSKLTKLINQVAAEG